MNIRSNSSTGYILEVDLEKLTIMNLHYELSDYPLVPEKVI